ncbi:MAG: uncharacterized protein A8A55_2135 [Amphiamblys sp. WSBS2006]|nr:MAG: uncharacterized protein A8A55_2135 [Amphiamblys sp. WSBS2006]
MKKAVFVPRAEQETSVVFKSIDVVLFYAEDLAGGERLPLVVFGRASSIVPVLSMCLEDSVLHRVWRMILLCMGVMHLCIVWRARLPFPLLPVLVAVSLVFAVCTLLKRCPVV